MYALKEQWILKWYLLDQAPMENNLSILNYLKKETLAGYLIPYFTQLTVSLK